MGMSGLAYHNSDIGGFTSSNNTPTTPELYTRWMEFGAFCPVMRAHGYDALGGTEPWVFGVSTENIVRKIIDLRYSLLPYNYTMAHETYESGIPLARPLVLEFSDDQNLYNESSAYMWGDDFLVAPVVQSGQTSKSFYLPQGKWIDFWNDLVYAGGQTITVPAPLGEVPLFVKAGSIIPMQPVEQYTDEFPADTILLAIYPGQNTTDNFNLYEDDGTTLDYQKGAFATTNLATSVIDDGSENDMTLSIGPSVGGYTGKPQHRVYVCSIHEISFSPASVSSGNLPIPNLQSEDGLATNSTGYFFDSTAHILHVKIQTVPDSSYQIKIDSTQISSIDKSLPIPSGYQLEQNYPNPFNPTTTITYTLSSRQRVTVSIYDVLGRNVRTLFNGEATAGKHRVVFDGRGLPSGVYIYRLTARPFDKSKVMALVK